LDLEFLSANPDVWSVMASVIPSVRENWTNMNKEEFKLKREKWGFERCSATAVLTANYSDIFMGHSTWMIYSFMNRVYKIIYTDLQDPALKARAHSFSSYPGVLCSQDDYYMASSGIGMIQTTNGMYNNSQYDLITPQMLLTWPRIRTAQSLASNGQQWSEIVGRYFSGTYTNQYIVVDFNQFTPGQPLGEGMLHIVEEITSTYHWADETQMLERGYWPSYNVPFFKDIYKLSGYPAVVQLYGTDESYDLAPRAKIFRRDITNVTSLDSFKYLMQYNDYQHDVFSEGSASNGIMARNDLLTTKPRASGGYDTKVTNYELFKKLQCHARSGPTTQGQPPFSWTNEFASSPHAGQPYTYNFSFVIMKPQLF
jgi:hypothetical protein